MAATFSRRWTVPARRWRSPSTGSVLRCIGPALVVVSVGLLVRAEGPELAPEPGVLIMRSGHVLRGNILRVGNRFVLTSGQQDELRIPVDRVEFRCGSLDEAYQRKRANLPANRTAHHHLELGNWCLNYGLLSGAAKELLEAQRIDPESPANARFEKRLRLAAHQPKEPVNSSSPVTAPTATETQPERLTEHLPPGAMRQFTATVQPLLMNRCSANACHGGHTDNPFRLIRPITGRRIPRNFTQANLEAVLDQIDTHEPWNSPLLVQPTMVKSRHLRIFHESDLDQLKLLASWIDDVTRTTRAAEGPSSGQPHTTTTEMPTVQVPAESSPGQPPAALPEPLHSSPIVASPLVADEPTTVPSAQDQPVARDPFDPEVFNRRYLKR
jgi:hypothetical protein